MWRKGWAQVAPRKGSHRHLVPLKRMRPPRSSGPRPLLRSSGSKWAIVTIVPLLLATFLGSAKASALSAGVPGQWSIVAGADVPSSYGGDPDLIAVSCAGPTSCIAVGGFTYGTDVDLPSPQPLVESWDGAAWSFVATPILGYVPLPPYQVSEGAELTGVSCTSTTSCVAVGFMYYCGAYLANESCQSTYTEPLAESWDGASWSVVPTPSPNVDPSTSPVVQLNAVSCTSPTNCVAVGVADQQNLIESWDGASWSIVPNPSISGLSYPPGLFGVSCTSATSCVAVGSQGDGFALIESWDGTSWSIVATPLIGRLLSVSCTSSTSCVAVGLGSVELWDGLSWQPSSSGENLYGVSCTSSTSCVAVGVGVIEVWDGVSWSLPPNQGGWMMGVSCGSSTSCVAPIYVYDQGTPYFETSGPDADVYVALGDSFSSGEGAVSSYTSFNDNNPSFYPGTDVWPGTTAVPEDACHRSVNAYSTLVASALGLQFDPATNFVACSGAVLDQLWKSTQNGYYEPAQLSAISGQPAVPGGDPYGPPNPNVGLVTLTIGGNDASFTPILTACLTVKLHNGRLLGDPRCASTIKADVQKGLDTLGAPGTGLYSALVEIHTLAPNATILLGGYPHLFANAPTGDCSVGGYELGGFPVYAPYKTMGLLNGAVNTLDNDLQSIAAAASAINVHYVNPLSAFAGHGLCDTGSSYINGLFTDPTTPDPMKWSFHPNIAGQAAYASLFEAAYLAYAQ
jgi:GDSL-like Lipase/Acylhydrolase family